MTTPQKGLPRALVALVALGPIFVGINRCNSGNDQPPAPYSPPHVVDRIVMPADGSCYARETAMGAIRPTSLWEPTPPPFCTDRPDITDWVTVDRVGEFTYFAFDAQGCLAAWREIPCP